MSFDGVLILSADDDVAVATKTLPAGHPIAPGVVALTEIPAGHKVALRAMVRGAAVHKYGQRIGDARVDIAAGAHVHVDELTVGDGHGGAVRSATPPRVVPPTRTTFEGFRRPSGKVGTRNYLGVVATVNCSATVCRTVAREAERTLLPRYPGIDGIVPIVHGQGCGSTAGGAGGEVLRRTIAGYLAHPNFAAVLLVGLGCEVNQISGYATKGPGAPADAFDIQEVGGTRAAVERALARLEALAPAANAARRETVPVSELTVGLQCGGSDGFSGISANPALGAAMDLLVAAGGAAILSETPEIYGAEHLLTARASPEVAAALEARIAWWEAHAAAAGATLDNNPSPGNKRGGLTTILEKSLGAVAKGGRSRLAAVVGYAEPVTARGLVFMDTPGYDPVSATGQVAGGANMIVFTTGRGSCFGCRPAPSLKVASNSALFARMRDDMDVDAGRIVEGTASVEAVGAEIWERLLDVASGEKTASERLGYGDDEFVPWQLGAVL